MLAQSFPRLVLSAHSQLEQALPALDGLITFNSSCNVKISRLTRLISKGRPDRIAQMVPKIELSFQTRTRRLAVLQRALRNMHQ
jgi:hypothetical protein